MARHVPSPRGMLSAPLSLLLVLALACGAAATATPQPTDTPPPIPTSDTTSGQPSANPETTSGDGTPTATPFAFAARSFIQELDEQFPFPPEAPPWPPRRGGVLHLPTNPKPTLDLLKGRDNEVHIMYDHLLEWESTWYFPEIHTTPKIRKNLVEDWEMVDPSTWDFKLVEGVRFHDQEPVGGREMTAQDVKYTYDTLSEAPAYTGALTVEDTEVLDPYSVRFHLDTPLTSFPLIHTDGSTPVVIPREAVEAPGGLGENPVGTGPFIFQEFVPGEGVLMEKNPDYHMTLKGEQLPFVDAVRLIFVQDRSTEMALFRSNQIDLIRPATLDSLQNLLDSNPDITLYRIPSYGWGAYGVFFNLEKEPFDDPKVRRALSMAINREVVKEVINSGDATLYGPFPWAAAGFTDLDQYTYENLGPNYQYDPNKARELLREAGVPEGFDITIEWGERQGYVWGDFAVLVQKFWNDVGLDVELKQLETSTWWAKSKCGTDEPFQDVLLTLMPYGSGPTPFDWAYQPHHSQSSPTINCPYIDDPKVDELLDQWAASPDEAEQTAAMRELWNYLTEQTYRVSTIVPPHYRVTHPHLHAGDNPYCWFTGYCSYEAKSAWLTEDAPARSYDRFTD